MLLTATLPFSFVQATSFAKNFDDEAQPAMQVSAYVKSESFSNILPIKQLLEDDWKQAPATDSSIGFTQNEVGIETRWQNISIGIAKRLDYFVFTNPDTATAFYLERNDIPLTTQENYQLALKLHHQESTGIRLGYQWQFDNFSSQIRIGYWDVDATRESQITGEISGEANNNINGVAELVEFYSDKNFLKRPNNDTWQTDGYGITVDLAFNWQVSQQIALNLDINDIYSRFKLSDLGYSQGNVDTDGTFINSLGGKSYLPLYRGVETNDDYRFDLPEQVNFVAQYTPQIDSGTLTNLGYLARYKRQGDTNFYYLGAQWIDSSYRAHLMLDLENLSPEFQFKNQWITFTLALDEVDLDKAMQANLGLALNYSF